MCEQMPAEAARAGAGLEGTIGESLRGYQPDPLSARMVISPNGYQHRRVISTEGLSTRVVINPSGYQPEWLSA